MSGIRDVQITERRSDQAEDAPPDEHPEYPGSGDLFPGRLVIAAGPEQTENGVHGPGCAYGYDPAGRQLRAGSDRRRRDEEGKPEHRMNSSLQDGAEYEKTRAVEREVQDVAMDENV